MVQFSSISTLVVLFTAFSVKGFLLNTNTSNHLLSSVQTTGYDANTIIHLFKRIDDLQLQIRQQSKTLEVQNKSMEVQANVIQQLLNFTKQAPSAVSLSNDLSILQTYVRGMLDEYYKLSNVSDATDDLALKINSIASSISIITSSLTTQEKRMNTMDSEFQQQMNSVNRSLISAVNRELQNDKNITSSLATQENRINTIDTEFQQQMTSLNRSLILAVNRVLQNEKDILSNCSSVSSVLARLERNISDMNDRIHILGAFGKFTEG